MSTFSNLLYHVVFSTKGRLPLISEEVKEPLYEYMGGIIRGEGGILLEIGGMPDHVHLLAKFRTDITVAVESRVFPWPPARPIPWRCKEEREQSRIRSVAEESGTVFDLGAELE